MKKLQDFLITEITERRVTSRQVQQLLGSVGKQIVDKDLTRKQIRDIIEKSLAPLDVEVEIEQNAAVSRNIITISGYYGEDEDVVGLFLVFHPDDKTVALSPNYWNWLRREIGDAISHEFIHQGQADKRDYIGGSDYRTKSKNPDMRYLGRPDEVEAFASNAADELKRAFRKQAASVLKNPFAKEVRDRVPTLNRYWEVFATVDDPVVKKLLVRIYKYL